MVKLKSASFSIPSWPLLFPPLSTGFLKVTYIDSIFGLK